MAETTGTLAEYTVTHDSIQTLRVRASSPNEAVRIARDARLTDWELTDKDDIDVVDTNGDNAEFDWGAVEDLWGSPSTPGAGVIGGAGQPDHSVALLVTAARGVIANWDHGDLAAAVRDLSAALREGGF